MDDATRIFLDSVVDSRFLGRRAISLRTGISCVARYPRDARSYQAVLRGILLPGSSRFPASRGPASNVRAAPIEPESPRALELCLFGCAPNTGNLGVSALCYSALSGLRREVPDCTVTVFDHGWGPRWGSAWMEDHALSFVLNGGRHSRRLHHASSLWNVRACARLGGMGNPGAEAILRADAVLDVSGGDSFTDLYGPKRFADVTFIKHMALEFGVPLILLPQTYGPFRSERHRQIAMKLVRGARAAWARDERSFETLRELLGDHFDPDRHRSGVDLAFGLAAKEPRAPLSPRLKEWLETERVEPVVGLNVSGLLYNDPRAARERYGLRVDYRELIDSLVRRFLQNSSARIVLVPHVRRSPNLSLDMDSSACLAVLGQIESASRERVMVLEAEVDSSEIKYVIGRLDWFCGTRMHSTIAALSSVVPVAAIAYSRKTLGVFETCGQGERVADPRHMDLEAVSDQVWQSWCDRESIREELQAKVPGVLEACRRQMRDIVGACANATVPVA